MNRESDFRFIFEHKHPKINRNIQRQTERSKDIREVGMKDQKNRMVNERDFRQDPHYVAPDNEKKKLILQLGTMITDRYLVKYSRTMNT